MDLFSYQAETHPDSSRKLGGVLQGPLAYRMRPKTLDEFCGQSALLEKGKPLRQWMEADRLPSLILWGTPGCGKTTLAELLATQTRSRFKKQSAVLSGVREIKEEAEKAQHFLQTQGQKTILFIDEIHRFSQTQQDALLPHVESGVLTLIGATTENPSYELTQALLSRCRILRFSALQKEDILTILRRAVNDPERGLGGSIKFAEDVFEALAFRSDGDARRALTDLESIAVAAGAIVHPQPWSWNEIQESFPALTVRTIKYDDRGDEHYHVISAFIKSIRDSDANAALYYLARMIEGGEDPVFIARRLVILSSEDVGLADPQALALAIACKDAVEFVGMPEGRIPLAQATVYLAEAKKSNRSYVGIQKAQAEVQVTGSLPVPMHLRNAVTNYDKSTGYGKGYQYAHEFKNASVDQEHFPEGVQEKKYLTPSKNSEKTN